MNSLKHIIFSLFFFSSSFLFSQERLVDINVVGLSLEEVIVQLEKKYGYLSSYKEGDIENINFSKPVPKGYIDDFLKNLLIDTHLKYEQLQEKYILFTRKDSEPGTVLKEKVIRISLCGQIVDSITQLPLSYANVIFEKTKTGTYAEEDGMFELKIPENSKDSITISYVGYRQKTFLATIFEKQPCLKINLSYLDYDEDVVVVTDYLTDGISLHDIGASTILRPNRVGALPGQVAPDVLNTIKFLPGVSSPDGSVSNLNIRGGTADQNLILWEGIPIYHSAHYFGMISAFNPYIVDKVDVYRGGFDASYGGRISGVIDLKSTDTNSNKSKFGAGINFINAFNYGEVSLLKNKARLMYSIRHSIFGLWRTPTFNNITRRIQQGVLLQIPIRDELPEEIQISDDFDFFDSNIKLSYQASDKDKLTFAAFYGNNDFKSVIQDDRVRQEQADTLYMENLGAGFNWTREWNTHLSSKIMAVHSEYDYTYDYIVRTIQGQRDNFGLKKSMIQEQQLHLVNSYKTKDEHAFQLGYQLSKYVVDYQIEKALGDNQQSDRNENLESKVQVLYAKYTSSQQKKVGLKAGLRLNHFEKEKRFYLEPRLQLWYKIKDELNLYISTGKYYQYLSQLIEIAGDNASIETPVWVLAGEREVPILDANQFQLGVIYNKKSWLIDVQAYYKNINGLTSLSIGFDEDLSNRYHLGTAKVRGIDILLKKRWRNYRSWISYSLSKVEYNFDSFFDENFNAPNDQPHQFNWVHSLTLNQWDFSLGWKISSGSPYSDRENFIIDIGSGMNSEDEVIRPIVNEVNSARLPALHQLDASVTFTLIPEKSKDWKAVIGLSLFNIYNQRNLYNRSFFIDIKPGQMGPPMLRYIDKGDLGITPNLLLRFEW